MPVYRAADGAELFYDEVGEGAPVVFISGGAARHPSYLGDLAGAGADRRRLTVHLRGVGRSPLPADETAASWWAQGDDLDALRVHLGLDRLDIVAHSAGTRVATAFAARHPERVGRLVLVTPPVAHLVDEPSDTAAIAARRAGDAAFQRAFAHLSTPAPLDDEADFAAWDAATAAAGYAHWGETERAHATVGTRAVPAARAYFSSPAPEAFAALLAETDAPVLVIAGAEDALTGCAPVVAAARLFRHGESIVLADCGHYPWIEQPAAFRAAVEEFLVR
ncbi:alpha/beta fold hydrolase [Microbacterium hibisci]|uniref:alpha/beta fold hydrolase n=1 Tax=Microbacterium hibisci TaxID=2036000 RepID=UPI001940445D|nr:alpha/beta hydrolase [Microbacterium hibisci]